MSSAAPLGGGGGSTVPSGGPLRSRAGSLRTSPSPHGPRSEGDRFIPMLPTIEVERIKEAGRHPAFFVVSWIAMSSITILFNKYILSNLNFAFPAILTCWHLTFATLMTQILARTTTLLDGRHTVKMTGRVYLRAILPIGVLYSLSLVCSNQTYLYLSVAFIQMLKASAPFGVLVTSYIFGISDPTLRVAINVILIVFGVALASFGEIKFVWIGFFYQMSGIAFESIRLVMIQILLSGEGQSMDPLVSLYYYAPVCAMMNGLVALVMEAGTFQVADLWRVGIVTMLANAGVAFLLNVASVFLIGKTSGLVMTLCGVLKNILLVLASVLLWSTIITPLQIIGYTLASGGLIYYGVGYDGILVYYHSTQSFVRKIWDGQIQPDTSTKPKFWSRKAIWMAVWVGLVLVLVAGLGLGVGTGRGQAFVKGLMGTGVDGEGSA